MVTTNSLELADHAMETTDSISQSSDDVVIESMLERFVTHILPVLCALGPGLSYEPLLLAKLARICQAFLAEKKFISSSSAASTTNGLAAAAADGNHNHHQHKEQTPPPQSCVNNTSVAAPPPPPPPSQVVKQMSKHELAFFNQIYTLLNEILLPSLSMLNMNPCLAIEVWNLMKLFPYEMR